MFSILPCSLRLLHQALQTGTDSSQHRPILDVCLDNARDRTHKHQRPLDGDGLLELHQPAPLTLDELAPLLHEADHLIPGSGIRGTALDCGLEGRERVGNASGILAVPCCLQGVAVDSASVFL